MSLLLRQKVWLVVRGYLLFGLLAVGGASLQSCIHRVAIEDGRPYYYENHVRVWRDGHNDDWHRAHGDTWEEERR